MSNQILSRGFGKGSALAIELSGDVYKIQGNLIRLQCVGSSLDEHPAPFFRQPFEKAASELSGDESSH